MINHKQKGFSLIELLIVLAIIGIIATIAVPSLIKAKSASENGAMFAMLRTISSAQIGFYSQNSRYATLSELNNSQGNTLGTSIGNNLRRGNFILDMGDVPADDPTLKSDYTITATKTYDSSNLPYIISVNASGQIVQITP